MTDFGMPTLIELSTLEQHARLCAELGLQFVEINMSFPQYQLERLRAEELNALRERYGIYFTIHMDESFDAASVKRAIREVYLDEALGVIDLAAQCAIPSLNLHLLRGIYVTLPERRTYVYAENEDEYLRNLAAFRDAVSTAIGQRDIRINLENTDGYTLPFLRHALDTLLQSPAFGLTLDIGHDHAIGGSDEPVILSYPGRLHHMHMHDGKGSSVHLALGDGEIDLRHFLTLAEENRCRVVLEAKTAAALQRSATYVHALGR